MDIFDLAAKISLDTSEFESGISAAKNSFQGLSSTAVAFGNAIYDVAKSAAQSIGSLAKSVVEVGSSFDSSMANVAAISGAAGDELDSLREKAKDMGATTKFSASEAADAFSYMAMAGWKTEDMLSGIDGIMSLAAASGEDLATTSDIVTDALTAFGLAAEDSGRFSDILAAASSNANTNVSMMGETFKYVAPLAGTLGYSVEDMAVAIGLMANSGIKASQAGTSLRSALTRLISPTDEAASLIADLGISLTDADGNMLPFSDTVEALRTAFAGLSESEQASAAATLFGQEAMSGMLAIINAAPGDIAKLTKAVENSGGAAEEMASVMEDNVGGALTKLKSALESAGIAIYETFSDTIKDKILFAADAVSKLTAAFEEGGLSGAVEKAGEIVGEIVDNLVLKIYEMTGIDLSPVVDIFKQISEAINKISEAFKNGGIGEAISETVRILSDEIPELILKILDGLAEHFAKFAEFGKKLFVSLVSALPDAIEEIKPTLKQFIINLGDAILEFSGLMLDTAIELISAMFSQIPEIISSIAPLIGELILEIVGKILELAGEFAEAGKELLINLMENFPDAIEEMKPKLEEFLKELGKAFLEFTDTLIDIAIEIISAMFSDIPKIVSTIAPLLKELILALIDEMLKLRGKFAEAGLKLLTSLGDNLPQIIATLSQNVTELIRALIPKIIEFIPEMILTGVDLFSALIADIPTILAAIIVGLIELIDGIVEEILYHKQDIIDAGADLFIGLGEGIANTVHDVIKSAEEACGMILDAIMKVFDEHSPSKVMMTVGAYLMDGLKIGVLDEGKKVENDIASAFESMIPSNLSTSVDFSSSSVGKSSAAMVNGIMASASDGGTYNINLNVDGRTLASVLFDPLNNIAQQKGVLIGNA